MKKIKYVFNWTFTSAIVLFISISLTTGVLSFSGDISIEKQKPIEYKNMERYGKIIKVKMEKLDYYRKLHSETWPEVLAAIHACNLRNFSIYYQDGYLFSYYEYVGEDYHSDMKKLSVLTSHWLEEIYPCQIPVESAKEGEWWSVMEEVFHTD